MRHKARWGTAGTFLIRTLATIGAVTALITLTPVVKWWGTALAGPWNDPTGDVLIVLGGSALDPEILGESSYWRSVYAIRAFQSGGFRHVVISGGGVDGGTVADPMATFLRCQGVPSGALYVERRSHSTRDNAIYTKEIIASLRGKKVLMTSDYHMTRAMGSFRRLGIDVVPSPIPDVIKRAGTFQGRFGAFVDVARETLALGYYAARGWL